MIVDLYAAAVVLFLLGLVLGRAFPRAQKMIWAAIGVRFTLLVIHHSIFELIPGRGDAGVFYREAVQMSASGFLGSLAQFDIGTSNGFSAISGALMVIFGTSPVVPEVFNIMLGVIAVVLTHRLVLNCGGDLPSAGLAAWIMALAPSLAQYSVVSLREMVVVVPLLLGLVALTKARSHQNAVGMLQFVGWCMVASAFHGAMIVAVFGLGAGLYVFQMFAARPQGRRGDPLAQRALMIGLFIGVSYFVAGWIGDSDLNKVGSVFERDLIRQVNAAAAQAAAGRSAYLEDFSVSGYGDLAAVAPLRVIYFYFSPLPWTISSPVHLLGFLDAVIYMWAFVMLWRSYRSNAISPKLALVLGIVMTLSLVYAFGTSNAGTAIRHRAKFSYALVAIACAARGRYLIQQRHLRARRAQRAAQAALSTRAARADSAT